MRTKTVARLCMYPTSVPPELRRPTLFGGTESHSQTTYHSGTTDTPVSSQLPVHNTNPGDSDSEQARRPTKRPRLDATSDLPSNPHSDGIVGTMRDVPTNTDDTPPNVPSAATTHQASFDGVMSSTIQSNANKLQVLIQELSKRSVYEAKKAVATDLAKLEADRQALQERARTLASDRERLNEERWKAARRSKELDAKDAAILRNKLAADELAKEIETSKKALAEEKRSLGDTKQAMDVLLNNLEQQAALVKEDWERLEEAKKASATTEKMRKRRDEKHRLEVQKLRTKLDEDRKAFEEVKRLAADMRKERLLEEKEKWMEEQNQRFKAAEQQWRCKYEDIRTAWTAAEELMNQWNSESVGRHQEMKRQLSLTEEKAAEKSKVQDAIITDLKKRFEEQAEELVGVRRAAEGAKHAFEIATQLKESVSAVEKAEWEKQCNQLMRALRVKIVTSQQCEATLKDEKVNTEIERRSLQQAIDKLTEELHEVHVKWQLYRWALEKEREVMTRTLKEFQNEWYKKVQMEEKAVAKGMEILRALEDRRKLLEGAEEENGAADS